MVNINPINESEVEISCGGASLRVQSIAGELYAYGLVGSGDPADLLELCGAIKTYGENARRILISVDMEQPDAARLLNLYQNHFGAREALRLLEVS